MPLEPGNSPSVVSRNISELTHHGSLPRNHSQIVAIALSNADRHPGHAVGGGIGSPQPFHLMPPPHAIAAPHQPMSPGQGTPWWTRSSEREMVKPPQHSGFAEGGGIGYAAGGMMPASEGSPWWERSQARIADVPFDGGLIGGSGAGRTDRLPLSVPSESHIIPSDATSALGQGSTVHGSKILEGALASGGPWGVSPPQIAHGKGPPSPPHMSASMTGMAEGGHARTSILAASSEVVVPPHDVEALGRRARVLGKCKGSESDMDCGHRLLDEMIANVRKFQIDWLKHAPKPKA